MEATIQNNKTTANYIIKAILFCIVFIALFVVLSSAKNFVPPGMERLAHGITGTLAAFLTTVLFLKFDRKRFSDIGLIFERKTIPKFFAGVAIGIVLMGSLAGGVLYFTNATLEVNPGSNIGRFLLLTAPLIPLAVMEELGFRAYPLEILKHKTGIRLSILTTSILFALYHVANGWSLASSFYGPAIWGLVFGLAAVYSKGIAMPTGIHYAANLTTSGFGAAENSVSLWIVKQPAGTVAKNASLLTVVVPALALLVFAIICIEWFVRRKTGAPKPLAKPGLAEPPSAMVR